MGKAENSVESHLIRQVRAAGGMCLKFSAQTTTGVPDRICILPGVGTVFVETKAPGGACSKIQLVRHDQMRAAGAQVYVASTRAAVDALIRSLKT